MADRSKVIEELKEEIKEITDSPTFIDDALTQDILEMLNDDKVNFSHIFKIKKYILNQNENHTLYPTATIGWLFNNIRTFHRIANNYNARRVFLSLKYPLNLMQISEKLKINRATVRHWIGIFQEIDVICLHEWREKNEKLYRRNLDFKQKEVEILDFFCLFKHKENARKHFDEKFSV